MKKKTICAHKTQMIDEDREVMNGSNEMQIISVKFGLQSATHQIRHLHINSFSETWNPDEKRWFATKIQHAIQNPNMYGDFLCLAFSISCNCKSNTNWMNHSKKKKRKKKSTSNHDALNCILHQVCGYLKCRTAQTNTTQIHLFKLFQIFSFYFHSVVVGWFLCD